MAELFLAALGVVFLILLLQKLEHAETKLLVKTLKWTLVGIMILGAFYLTLVGRLLQVAALVVLLILLLKQEVHEWVKKKSPPLPLSPPLTENEAASLLEVDVTASVEEIERAFKKIKPKDSTEHDKLTQARDVLVQKKR